ncbi:hypothetical protein GALMADRAFT_241241 [Galerina marginata CBS 339.88]|uniref:Uncharacterized protein n=1 Tax=Galerina marginata (strain CBS 339.88) TaxID=685588 RepID=A0A067TLK8_GALM3|nr:hypothetical protein GALMADRAFT_241241 [Galerina marginata CBS 339.88]
MPSIIYRVLIFALVLVLPFSALNRLQSPALLTPSIITTASSTRSHPDPRTHPNPTSTSDSINICFISYLVFYPLSPHFAALAMSAIEPTDQSTHTRVSLLQSH